MRILVTGATGFVGHALCKSLGAVDQYNVVGTSRRDVSFDEDVDVININDVVSFSDWENVLNGIDVVVHTIGRAHVLNEKGNDPISEFRRINTDATLQIARAAAKVGVKRFIFLSSIKVNGENSVPGVPFTSQDREQPESPCGLSKFEAEQGLLDVAQQSDMDVVIVRLPLVYGAGVKANFQSLIRIVSKGMPLPLGKVTDNRRSFIFLGNLIDFIKLCVVHPEAANEVFLVSDDDDMSTVTLIKRLSVAMNTSAVLLPLPLSFFECVMNIMNKRGMYQRLCGSQQLDISKAKELLGWVPPYSVEEGIQKTIVQAIPSSVAGSSTLRMFDLCFATVGLAVLWPLLALVTIFGFFDTGSPFFLQERVGRGKKKFILIKFRTMKKSTESVASHLVSASSITPLGNFLRKSKIDELPQLINVIRGEMSLVGPRPNLFNQEELMAAREALGIYKVLPGITGLAQVNNVDMSTPEYLAETDCKMIKTLTIKNYFKYIMMTAFGKGTGDTVNH